MDKAMTPLAPPGDAGPVRLSLLGDFRLEIAGCERRIASRKARLLLARLALADGAMVARANLLALLWEDRGTEQASASLRTALAELRRSLGDHADLIRGGEGGLAVDLARLRVDTVELARLLETTTAEAALPLLRGELLQSETAAEPEIQEWLEAERRRFRHLATVVLDAALGAAVAAKAFARAVEIALRALALEPLREKLHRELMRIFAAMGEPARALRQYRELEERLRDELGVAPEPETLRLFEAIRARRRLPVAGAAVPNLAPARGGIRFCQSRDGVRLAYAASGQGMPLVKVGRWMTQIDHEWDTPVWHPWVDALSRRFHLHRFDARGTGLSDRDADDVSFDRMVDDLEAVIDAARLDRPVLMGVTQGCAVSIAYAARHPGKVRGLILYSGYARGWRARGDAGEIARRAAMNVLTREGWAKGAVAFPQLFTSWWIPGANAEQMDCFNRMLQLCVVPTTSARLVEVYGRIDVTACLPRIACPTLVLHPRGSQPVPLAAAREMAVGIPKARFVALESGNHVVLGDEPAFAQAMQEIDHFAAGLESTHLPAAAAA